MPTPDDNLSFDEPAVSSIADLGRILVLLHGANAPSAATLKKWSAGGEFRACLLPEGDVSGVPTRSAPTHGEGSALRARRGRPGLRLSTDRAIARVYELWPQLVESSNPASVFEQAVV